MLFGIIKDIKITHAYVYGRIAMCFMTVLCECCAKVSRLHAHSHIQVHVTKDGEEEKQQPVKCSIRHF